MFLRSPDAGESVAKKVRPKINKSISGGFTTLERSSPQPTARGMLADTGPNPKSFGRQGRQKSLQPAGMSQGVLSEEICALKFFAPLQGKTKSLQLKSWLDVKLQNSHNLFIFSQKKVSNKFSFIRPTEITHLCFELERLCFCTFPTH